MNNFLTQLLNLIYKKRCFLCKSTKENAKVCSKCLSEIKFLPFKPVKNVFGADVYSVCVYRDKIQKLIRGLKYYNQKELAVFQAQLMFDYWKNLSFSEEKFVIVPVPLYKKREKKRKYNHMHLVAQEFSKLSGYEINNNLIKRIKNTKPQYKLSMKERAENLHGAFECESDNYHGETLLIFDDILTTGSTVFEMIKVFEAEKINKIKVFVTSCTEYNVN